MGMFLLEFAVEETLRKAGLLVVDQISVVWGLKRDLQRLKESFTMIRAVLSDAEERQARDKAVRLWLEKLSDAAYDAEDLLDEFASETLRQKVEVQNQLMGKVRNLFSSAAYRVNMARKVKKINRMLDRIKSDAAGYGHRVSAAGDKMIAHDQLVGLNHETDSYLDDSVVVGRGDDVTRIIGLLVSLSHNNINDNNNNQQAVLPVIPIVGMAGLGKTTLAKLVCKTSKDRKFYDVIMWVCVSDEFDDRKILGAMLQTLDRYIGGINHLDAMLQHLEMELERKRFLLVLDDVWNEDPKKWESLRSRLLKISGSSKRNAIIVTTRSGQVASLMETSPLCRQNLEGLTDDECWLIIKDRVSGNGAPAACSDMEAIGREIACKCRGVPLAAKVLGGMLGRKRNKEEWLLIRNSNVWDAPMHKDGILPVLKLSFDRLPSSLKPCFAYCSIFQKDVEIEKEQLIQLWMAHGFLGPSESDGGITAREDVGDEDFNYLHVSSFFQDAKRDEFDNIVSCKMHDLALSVSASDTLNLKAASVALNHDTSRIRHLNLISDAKSGPKLTKGGGRKLRSLFTADGFLCRSWNFNSLRSLNFDGADIEKLPASIGEMKHLRYLDVSRTRIEALPKSLTKLYNLQTLRLNRCESLEKLPRKMRNLIALRHISFTYSHQMPADIRSLSCLQTLPLFVVGPRRGYKIEELQSLNELRGKLSIIDLEHVRDRGEAERANLVGKVKIHALGYAWSFGRQSFENDEEVLEGLQPHPYLKSLEIEHYMGGKFPPWLLMMENIPVPRPGDSSLLGNLVKLKLKGCRKVAQIPKLGHLPCLQFLEIAFLENVRLIGTEFYTNERESLPVLFPALKWFSLCQMQSLVEWTSPAAADGGNDAALFPCLNELSIYGCSLLTGVNPISRLASLVQLEIVDCDKLSHLSDELHGLRSLEDLRIVHCRNLVSIPDIQHLVSLKRLSIECCQRLKSLPCGLRHCSSLETLCIDRCRELLSIPDDMQQLDSLVYLGITDCPSLKYLPQNSLCYLTRLEGLRIGPFSKELEAFPGLNSIQNLQKSLKYVSIFGWDKLDSLPDQLQHLTSLESLVIYEFHQMHALPEWLGNLSSLQQLSVSKCKQLMCLPTREAMQRLSNLKKLDIILCPLLRRSCTKGTGCEWPKISHIPEIVTE